MPSGIPQENENTVYLECKRCSHKWVPRGKVAPKRCPKCVSVYWLTGNIEHAMNNWWAALTPEQRTAQIRRSRDGANKYHKERRPAKVAKLIKIMKSPTEGQIKTPWGRSGVRVKLNPRKIKGVCQAPGETCTVLEAHHEMLKDDPERLTTEFLQEMIGKKCDIVDADNGEE